MNADDEKRNACCEHPEELVKDAIGPAAEAPRSVQPEFRTVVAVAKLTVNGVLPAAARPQVEGSVAISGDVQRLSCDEALELVDALLLVVIRIDAITEERHRASTTATHDRGN
jgi:hypothetical protein